MTDDPDRRCWSAPPAAVVLGVVATLGLGAWAVTAADPPGRLLVGVAAVAVLAVTLMGGLARPRLAADPEGLTLRGPTGARTWPWARVDAVRVVTMRRLGVPGAYVEVDARDDDGTERLLVLGRLELGTDPVDVADALQHHRATAGRRRPEQADPADPADPSRPSHQDGRPDDDEDDQQHGEDAGEGQAQGGP